MSGISRFPVPALEDLPNDIRERILAVQERSGFVPHVFLAQWALAAVGIALWDLQGKALGQPLWLLAGGASPRVPLYDTEGGWLHLSTEDLVAGGAAISGP
jgi:L-alanine-DL-glutamate epimerase-like enolase superfamily enzyme